ncbi:hypothetical protein RE628_19495 [Paenibacillus sp. D2_2]|uniref:hypothetical protein n=1 Tax=Paenibacillus sp. D2_2 TaxID=3073092 RepID=UPI00281658E7|nr:hypothetical protein [Paenibacillus sp. D2_2]WMT39572.1 hypothetical protein RE628_19495 [Paenibacillus sp. D2_2]
MIHRTFKQGDLVLIAVVLSIALLIIGARWIMGSSEASVKPSGHYYATIKVDNKIYKTVELTSETQYVEVKTSRGYDRLRSMTMESRLSNPIARRRSASLLDILRNREM